jgi:16S rRNA (guanine(527)-N(7))-methyltransferase RsmG
MSDAREPLPPDAFRGLLEVELPRFALTVPPDAELDRLARFLAELDRWRARINLTGRLSTRELVGHTAESLAGGRFLPIGARVADIGTGGGFPGVPLAIVRADLDVTWVEPRDKRVAFLRHVQRTAPVPNARILAARVEDLPRGTFDAATSRAVAVAEGFRQAPFLLRHGRLVLWTTEPERLAGALAPDFQFEDAVEIPFSRHRRIVVFRKS